MLASSLADASAGAGNASASAIASCGPACGSAMNRSISAPYDPCMADIETGVLPAGHPYAGSGRDRGPCCTCPGCRSQQSPRRSPSTRRSWKRWLEPIAQHDLTLVQVGRRADLPPGSTAADVADDYASVIRAQWGSAVGVMGISTGGHYAQWLAIRHPELVERLVLGFTAHRVPDDVKVRQRRAVDHFLAGQWRQGWALFGRWALPRFPRVASAALWLVGPYVGGRYSDLRVLAIDADSDEAHDSTPTSARSAARRWSHPAAVTLAYPPDLVRELVAGIPNARHIQYAKAGHMGPERSSVRTPARSWRVAPRPRHRPGGTRRAGGSRAASHRPRRGPSERGRGSGSSPSGTPIRAMSSSTSGRRRHYRARTS